MQEVLKLRKGPWLEQEDGQLAAAVAVLGERRWDSLAKSSGLKRSGKSCRLRWMNYLRPNLKHGNMTEEERRLIVQLHEKWGSKWSKIAMRLPGRTDNEIKNYWRTNLRRKAITHEKESSKENIDVAGSNSMPSCSNGKGVLLTNDNSGYFADESSEVMSSAQSPYETRLTDWMSNWSYDLSTTTEPDKEFWKFDVYHPEWISGDCSTGVWDVSLWGGE